MRDFIWTPDQGTPPQVAPAVAATIASRFDEVGIARVAQVSVLRLQNNYERFGLLLDEFGASLNDIISEPWPERTLKIGAAVGMLAYYNSGYEQMIDDQAIEIGQFAAEMNGVPDTYIATLPEDPNLFQLTRKIAEASIFDETDVAITPQDKGGYEQVLTIGAGCARHFLQQTLVA